jgi:hypothetical protein
MMLIPDNCRMKDWKIGDRTVDIQDGAVHGIGERKSLPRQIRMVAPVRVVKIRILNQTLGWRILCSFGHKMN